METYKWVKRVASLRETHSVSGTPIQNNLTELWSLLNWLGEPNYGSNKTLFKHQVN